MASKEYVCHNYVVLKPKEASLAELICLLCSSDHLKKRSFIEFSDSDQDQGDKSLEFRRRWIIFISVVVQKLFLHLKTPMAMLGDVLVSFLNLVATNGGIFALLRNYFKGKNLLALKFPGIKKKKKKNLLVKPESN